MRDLVRSELIFCRGTPPQAICTFKHALVQHAAYGSMLRGHRQQLHARIVTVLEEQFPEIVTADPGLLAQHCTEAGLTDKAVAYWLSAGRQASARSMMAEAVTVLRKGLALLPDLPDGVERQERELDMQISLGQAVTAREGNGSPAVGQAYTRAHQLCEELNLPDRLLTVLQGEWIHEHAIGRLDRALRLSTEMRNLAEKQKDRVAFVRAFRSSGSTAFYRGDFALAREYLEEGLRLYEPAQRSLARVSMLQHMSHAMVVSGYLDQGQSCRHAALAEARQLAHPHTLAFSLNATWLTCCAARACPEALLRHADELAALSSERGFPHWRAVALTHRGWCLTVLGHADEGIPLLVSSLDDCRARRFSIGECHHLTLLADAYRIAGQLHAPIANTAEAERTAEITQVKWFLAETLRLRGDLLALTGDQVAAEASFRDSIALAARQGARLFELRASTSLARLWRDQARSAVARDLLARVYNWFTEGFDAPDLREAKTLLAELSHQSGIATSTSL